MGLRSTTRKRTPESGFEPAGSGLRVAIVGSPEKRAAAEVLARLTRWLKGRAEVVFSEITSDITSVAQAAPDILFVLGGDGTLIGAVHELGDRQVPVLGVNLGKLGYLAEFTIEDLEREGEFLFNSTLPVTRRLMLAVEHRAADARVTREIAVNDCVVLAGPPYRMIEFTVEASGDEVARIRGDGLIISTPSGSTAHNLSAGGPILDPTAHSIILTPICPHALTYRPLVMGSDKLVTISMVRANQGTTVVVDGRSPLPFRYGDQVSISRHASDFLLVRNPRHSPWHSLRRKLKWGEWPTMQ